jgi:hypothetical protein
VWAQRLGGKRVVAGLDILSTGRAFESDICHRVKHIYPIKYGKQYAADFRFIGGKVGELSVGPSLASYW